MPDRMSEFMSERMPDRMPDRMLEYMSERMPERMPDRMSEYMGRGIKLAFFFCIFFGVRGWVPCFFIVFPAVLINFPIVFASFPAFSSIFHSSL